MTHRSFEKQIADKLNRIEVQPSENLLDTILEKRAAGSGRFVWKRFALAALAVVATAVFVFYYTGKEQIPAENGKILADQKAPLAESSALASKNPPAENAGTDAVSAPASDRPARKKPSQRLAGSAISGPFISPSVPIRAHSPSPGMARSGMISDASYFDLNASGRPSIDREQHSGNSHLYVYHTASESELALHGVLSSIPGKIRKIPLGLQEESLQMMPYLQSEKRLATLRKKPVFIDFLYMPSMNVASGEGDDEALSAAYRSLDRATYNTQAGVRVSLPLRDRFSVFTALFFRAQSNLYKGELHYETDETRVDQKISYINDPVKGVIPVTTYDTVRFRQSNTQSVHHRNTSKLWQIPLGLSYNFGKGKFDFALHASVLLNAFSQSAGEVLELSQHNTRSYRSSSVYMGTGAGFSTMAAYKISPRFRLLFEPGIQYYGMNSVSAGNNIRERVYSPHCTLGIRYTAF